MEVKETIFCPQGCHSLVLLGTWEATWAPGDSIYVLTGKAQGHLAVIASQLLGATGGSKRTNRKEAVRFCSRCSGACGCKRGHLRAPKMAWDRSWESGNQPAQLEANEPGVRPGPSWGGPASSAGGGVRRALGPESGRGKRLVPGTGSSRFRGYLFWAGSTGAVCTRGPRR